MRDKNGSGLWHTGQSQETPCQPLAELDLAGQCGSQQKGVMTQQAEALDAGNLVICGTGAGEGIARKDMEKKRRGESSRQMCTEKAESREREGPGSTHRAKQDKTLETHPLISHLSVAMESPIVTDDLRQIQEGFQGKKYSVFLCLPLNSNFFCNLHTQGLGRLLKSDEIKVRVPSPSLV